MVGYLLASHGNLSEGVLSTLNLICGPQDKVATLTLQGDDDIDAFEEKIAKPVEELNDGDGVIIMCDLLGGTPCNKSARLLANKDVEILCGLNFPMLLGAYEARLQGLDLQATKAHCLEAAKDGVVCLREKLGM